MLNLQSFFFSSWFDFTWLKVSSCYRIHIRMHAVVHHFFFLAFSFFVVVIKCSSSFTLEIVMKTLTGVSHNV